MAASSSCPPSSPPCTSAQDMPSGVNGRVYCIVILLCKHRLSLSKLVKPQNVRIYVVAPARMLYEETNVDVYYQVEMPMGENDFSPMLHKARELASMYSTSLVRLVTLEKGLQRAVAKLRYEMSLEGFTPEQVDALSRVRDAGGLTRRGGLPTPRQTILCGTPQMECWMEVIHSQLGGYPIYVRPTRLGTDLTKTIIGVEKIHSDDEFHQWIRRIYSACGGGSEWVMEECFEDGCEFVALATPTAGLHYCVATLESERTLFDALYHQRIYALQLYSVDQTRDHLPGVESFIMQTTKALFPKGYQGAVFIRGYYKAHNDIFLLGVDLQPPCDTHRSLFSLPKDSPGWEALSINSLYAEDGSQMDYSNGAVPSLFHAVVNFPTQEGVLLHQTTVPKRRTSGMRVAWRVAEGEEMRDCMGVDYNVMQVFMWNTEQTRLLEELNDVMKRVDITIDRNPVVERNAAVRRHLSRLGNTNQFVRSCTTTD